MKHSKVILLVLAMQLIMLGSMQLGDCAELPVLKVGHVGHDHQIALYVAADEGKALYKTYGVYLEKLKDQQKIERNKNDDHRQEETERIALGCALCVGRTN